MMSAPKYGSKVTSCYSRVRDAMHLLLDAFRLDVVVLFYFFLTLFPCPSLSLSLSPSLLFSLTHLNFSKSYDQGGIEHFFVFRLFSPFHLSPSFSTVPCSRSWWIPTISEFELFHSLILSLLYLFKL